MTLTALGWTPQDAEAFGRLRAGDLVPARVAVAYGATFRVYLEDGETLADISGRMRHDAQGRRDLPAVGDWVAVKRNEQADRATIQAILPRRSLFSRKVAGDQTAEQIMAANVDTAFLVTGLDHDFNVRRVERYLAVTWSSGARPVIVLNKADLAQNLDAQCDEVRAIAIDVPIHAVSAKAEHGLDALEPYLQPGQTVALLGSSGVGKSTIINRLLGEDRLRTNEVRASDQRGRHTTTHRELVPLPGGALLIDTPGMRELQLWSADEGLQETFDDVEARAVDCYFKDCRHDSEPRCAVKAAVADGAIPEARLQSYLKLQREQRQLEARQDALAQQAMKRQARAGAKALQKRIQDKGRE